jgi:disulfide bond formation protein DsbB
MLVPPAKSQTLLATNPALAGALLIALGGVATIAGAWFFQLVIGLPPCPLCLEQRWAYYVGIPLALVVALAAWRGAPRGLVLAGLLGLAAVFLFGAGLAAYHAGIEWKWWPGPQECSGPMPPPSSGGGLLGQLQSITIVRCDEIPWQFLGLSLAGWNVLISLGLAGVALMAVQATRRSYPSS